MEINLKAQNRGRADNRIYTINNFNDAIVFARHGEYQWLNVCLH